MNQDGLVDGTVIREKDLRVWRLVDTAWKTVEYNGSSSVIDIRQNTVTVKITGIGTYTVMAVATDPVIDNVVVYPTPFADTTKISFNVAAQCDIKTEIYTVTGRLLKTLSKTVGVNDTGYVEFVYDGTDKDNNQLANGTYLYKITAKNDGMTRVKPGKFVKLK
jgi:hypothetical protein